MARPDKCPNCGSDQVVPIIYGKVTQELAEKAQNGELRVGGYGVGRQLPEWACNNCGNTWKSS